MAFTLRFRALYQNQVYLQANWMQDPLAKLHILHIHKLHIYTKVYFGYSPTEKIATIKRSSFSKLKLEINSTLKVHFPYVTF